MVFFKVRVKKETNEKIAKLVKAGRYKNKSEALREIIEEHFEKHAGLFPSDNLGEIAEEAGKMPDGEFDRLAAEIFRGPRTAAELVRGGRRS